MKKYLLAALLAATALSASAFSTAELARILQKPDNIQGGFIQYRHLKSLSKPMAATGKFVLMPKRGLLWQMQKPFAATLRVRSDGISQWNGKGWIMPDTGKFSGQSRQIKLFLDLIGGDTQGLEKQFDLKLEGSAQKWTLQLTPKTLLMKQIFNHIDISGDSVVRRIELHEKQGDKTDMRFDGISVGNPPDKFAEQSL